MLTITKQKARQIGYGHRRKLVLKTAGFMQRRVFDAFRKLFNDSSSSKFGWVLSEVKE